MSWFPSIIGQLLSACGNKVNADRRRKRGNTKSSGKFRSKSVISSKLLRDRRNKKLSFQKSLRKEKRKISIFE